MIGPAGYAAQSAPVRCPDVRRRRVAQHCTVRPFRQRIGQLRTSFTSKVISSPIPARRALVRHVESPVRRCPNRKNESYTQQAFTGTSLRFRFHFLPDSFICCAQPLKPQRPRCKPGARSVPASPLQSATYRNHTSDRAAGSWLPAGSHHNSGCQGFFDRAIPARSR